jgi:hypothetical protein
MAVVRYIGRIVLLAVGFLTGLMSGVLASGLALLLAEGAGNLWAPLALLVYGFLLLFVMVVFLGLPSLVKSSQNQGSISVWTMSLAFPLFYLSVFIILSGEFMRQWSLQFGGFSSQGGDYVDWASYSISWLLDNGLGNFGQIFGWDITTIQPINDTARSVVWSYNLVLEFLAITAVVKTVRVVTAYWTRATRQAAAAPATDNQTEGA